MEESLGKITWGYIWRLIVWSLLLAFVLGYVGSFLVTAISGASIVNSLESMIAYYKKLLVVALIISIVVTVVACKFATSGIQKKFTINSTNNKQVFKRIVIVLIVFIVIYLLSNLTNISEYKETMEQYNEVISLTKTQETDVLKDFINFANVFTIISIILNTLEMLVMIPFEKKLLGVE